MKASPCHHGSATQKTDVAGTESIEKERLMPIKSCFRVVLSLALVAFAGVAFAQLPQPSLPTAPSAPVVWNLTIKLSFSPPAGGVVNYSNGAPAPAISPVTNGTTISLAAAPIAGSIFTGWSGGGCSGTGSCRVYMDNHKSVTASFAIPTLTVQVNGTGTGNIATQPGGIDCGNGKSDCSEALLKGTSVSFSATTGTGFLDGQSCGNTITLNGNTTCTFTFNKPVLTVAKSGNGTLSATGINCGTDCTEAVNLGTAVSITATPGSGVVLRRWTNGCTHSATTCNMTLSANKTATADFGRPYVSVTKTGTGTGTVTSQPSVINCGSTCSGEFDPTTNVGLTATPDSGSIFEGWSGDFNAVSNSQPRQAQVNTSTKPWAQGSAKFTKFYTLTVTVKGNGSVTSGDGKINCPGDCEERYTSGSTVVMLTYKVGSGSAFIAWGGSCSGTNPDCKVSLASANRAVTAEFK